MKRRIFALTLALLLCTALTVSASADAYIPPEYSPPYDITSAHWDNGTCSALNTFLSNFVEVNLQNYTILNINKMYEQHNVKCNLSNLNRKRKGIGA